MKHKSSILLAMTLCLAPVAQARFTIMAVPDTQKYSETCALQWGPT